MFPLKNLGKALCIQVEAQGGGFRVGANGLFNIVRNEITSESRQQRKRGLSPEEYHHVEPGWEKVEGQPEQEEGPAEHEKEGCGRGNEEGH